MFRYHNLKRQRCVRGVALAILIATAAGSTSKAQDKSDRFPVELQVFYDNVEQPVQLADKSSGRVNLRMKDPRKNQVVTFGLKNHTADTVGVVLTVNGINTLHEEVGPPQTLKKWVLQPGKQYRIKGFHQKDHQTYKKIKGLSDEDSLKVFAALEDIGGRGTAGLIRMYVFRKSAAGDSPSVSRGLMLQTREKGREAIKTVSLGATTLTDTMVIRYYTRSGSGG